MPRHQIFHRESIRLSSVTFPLNYIVIKHQYLAILFFLGIWESKFPSPFAVRQDYVTTNGQWNISRTDLCPSEMEAGSKSLHNSPVSSIASWSESMESVCWDDRTTTAWIIESSHGGQLPGSITQLITDFSGASKKPSMFSCWDFGTVYYNTVTYSKTPLNICKFLVRYNQRSGEWVIYVCYKLLITCDKLNWCLGVIKFLSEGMY